MMGFAGAVARFGVVVLRSLVRLMFGAVPRVVAVMVLRRFGGVVAAARVVVVVGTPGRGTPVRHIATSIQQVDGEDGVTGYSVTIHRAAISIAVNRKTVRIIAGCSPCHRRAVAVRGEAERAVTIRVYLAGTE